MTILATSNSVYAQPVLTAATWSGVAELCVGFNSISITAQATGSATLLYYTGYSGALTLEATIPIQAASTARLVLPVSYTAFRCGIVNTAGVTNTISIETLMHKASLSSTWPPGSSGLMIDSVPHGSEGNLMDSVAVIAVNTDSTEVNVSQMGDATVCVAGSNLAATLPFDVWISHDATRWYLVGSIYPAAVDGNSAALAERCGTLPINLTGINWLKVVAHDTETVTASILG